MRAVVFAVSLALLLPGCFGDLVPRFGSKVCPSDEEVTDGFRVTVPELANPEDSKSQTLGWCVSVRASNWSTDRFNEQRQVPEDHMVLLPIDGAGSYNIELLVIQPQDSYCAYTLDASRVNHTGSGWVDVELVYEGVSLCA